MYKQTGMLLLLIIYVACSTNGFSSGKPTGYSTVPGTKLIFVQGPLVELIAKQLEATSDRIPDTPKFLMLSAHDTTLLNLMNSLSIYDMVPPKYSSAVIFELRQGSDTQYVNIFYKNGTYSDEAYAKTLFGCEFDCCLKEFKEIVAPLRIDEESWERECWDSK